MVLYTALFFCFIIYVTRKGSLIAFCCAPLNLMSLSLAVVPGRVVRMVAVSNMNVLKLKRLFVRLISHEIR